MFPQLSTPNPTNRITGIKQTHCNARTRKHSEEVGIKTPDVGELVGSGAAETVDERVDD